MCCSIVWKTNWWLEIFHIATDEFTLSLFLSEACIQGTMISLVRSAYFPLSHSLKIMFTIVCPGYCSFFFLLVRFASPFLFIYYLRLSHDFHSASANIYDVWVAFCFLYVWRLTLLISFVWVIYYFEQTDIAYTVVSCLFIRCIEATSMT